MPGRLRGDHSQGYRYSNATFEPAGWEYITAALPAGVIGASAGDMARFMLAHLGNGALGERRILADSTAERMHARAFEHDPRLPGCCLGFYEQSSHGLRIIGHAGDTRWFHTDLTLIPADGVGVFVSYNTDKAHWLSAERFLNEFLDHYYPTAPPPRLTGPAAREQAARVAGEYQYNRRSYTTYQKAVGLTGAVTIRANADGSLRMTTASGEMRLLPIGPLFYEQENGSERVAFQPEGAGRVTRAFTASRPVMALERAAWNESPRLHWVILGGGLLVFLAALCAAIGRFIRRRLRKTRPHDALPGRPFVFWLATANLAFVITLLVLLSDDTKFFSGPQTGFKITLALPVIGAALTLAAAVAALRQWRSGAGTAGARLRYAGVVLVGALFAWSLAQWKLLGWWF